MKITIEIDERSEVVKLTAFFKAFNIETVSMVKTDGETKHIITKGDKSIDPEALFGIWEKEPKNLDDIRKAGWQKR
ncbi:hypothetical protein FPZ43_07295 [Mucilaginibacter pallidiroseus]|uniref:Uncharacterized protein n=1 Tax=Mucilaginibacter pallidiroseus TaxID=2599295 RepID=A0A563UEH1_9SPHI|nr:hypothetical protein [Mucilaginibacter pallidiroseus]TWR29659.1 hypothetical protein FPZ43_07295 [Mucilaginibacter pallidiroseus]